MSRIHEALQRAYLERGKNPVLADFQVTEPDEPTQVASVLDGPPLVNNAEIELENVTQHTWKPMLASFPTLADRGAGVEQFRSLRSHVYQARYEAPLKTVLIASGMPSEGKSFVAANLAMSLARNSIHNILLIDGDLRRPSLHSLLGAPNMAGLSDYLEGDAEVFDILQRDRDRGANDESGIKTIANLTLITSGTSTDHSTELVASDRMKELIKSVSSSFDWIVIDAPPVLVVSDAIEMSRAADAVLLVARGATTPYEVAQRTQSAFGNSRILGFVLNDVKDAPRRGSYNYNYNYYYRKDSDSSAQSKPGKDNGR
jgi:capsular exopolysaccharide synthesis family protein